MTSNTACFSSTSTEPVYVHIGTNAAYWLSDRADLPEWYPIDHSIRFAVYCAVNLVNGKIYVGATSKGISSRRSNHFCRAKRGEDGIFVRAINKYGRANFEFVMLKRCSGWDDALASERKFIALLSPEYNATDGGGGVFGLKHSEETKRKMSAAKIGKPSIWSKTKMPQAIRDKIAATRRSERGRKITDIKRLEDVRGFCALGNAKRRRRVLCVSDGKEYASVTDAAEAYGLTTGSVSYLCNSEERSRRGLKFRRLKRA